MNSNFFVRFYTVVCTEKKILQKQTANKFLKHLQRNGK